MNKAAPPPLRSVCDEYLPKCLRLRLRRILCEAAGPRQAEVWSFGQRMLKSCTVLLTFLLHLLRVPVSLLAVLCLPRADRTRQKKCGAHRRALIVEQKGWSKAGTLVRTSRLRKEPCKNAALLKALQPEPRDVNDFTSAVAGLGVPLHKAQARNGM